MTVEISVVVAVAVVLVVVVAVFAELSILKFKIRKRDFLLKSIYPFHQD
jgi:hypothetical protein